MERVFEIGPGGPVPDGTVIRPLLNPLDAAFGLPESIAATFSIAAGELGPGTRSQVHVLPHSTQVTFVLEGTLTARMQGPADAAPYTLRVPPHAACLTLPGERLQLINDTDAPVRVLYIVQPPYKAECDAQGNVISEDAVLLGSDWDRPDPA